MRITLSLLALSLLLLLNSCNSSLLSFGKQHKLDLIKRETKEICLQKKTSQQTVKIHIQQQEIITHSTPANHKTKITPKLELEPSLSANKNKCTKEILAQQTFRKKENKITPTELLDFDKKKNIKLGLLLILIGLICLPFIEFLGLIGLYAIIAGAALTLISLFTKSEEDDDDDEKPTDKKLNAATVNHCLNWGGLGLIIAAAILSILTTAFALSGILLTAGALALFVGICMAFARKEQALKTLSLILFLIGCVTGLFTLIVLLLRNMDLGGNSTYF
jgi:hypothetical protein